MQKIAPFIFHGCLFTASVSAAEMPMKPRTAYPQIISHRGACGYVPEHSLQAHQLAIDLGTDYIEPDLCLSKDEVLVVMHDNYLDDTTDVRDHPEFADRETDGKFYVYDFTLAELKTLRLHQRSSERTSLYDGVFTIPTFTEILDLVMENYNSSGGWLTGVYPELKRPSSTNAMFNISMEEKVLGVLESYGYEITGVSQDLNLVQPVVLQSFEASSLQILKNLTDIPLQQLWSGSNDWATEADLDNIATYAQGFGPAKALFDDAGVDLTEARSRVQMVHEKGLFLHPYVFRRENTDARFNNDPDVEAAYYYCCLGMDATFTEFPDYMRETINGMTLNRDEICSLGGC